MKSRSIGCVAAAAAAAAAAAEPEAEETEVCCASDPAGATDGEPSTVVDAELGSGDRDEVPATDDEVDEAGSTEVADAIGANVDGIGWAEVRIVVGVGAGDATGTPGGGDATASGSSINSTGKSGSCSSNGESGTSARASGSVCLIAVAEVDALVDGDGAWDVRGLEANCPCDDVMAALGEMPLGGAGTVDAFDRPGVASDEVGEPAPADIAEAADALADVPVSVGAVVVGALNVVPDGVGPVGDVLTDVRDIGGTAADVLAGVPAKVGTVVVGALNAVPDGFVGEVLADDLDPVGAAVDVLTDVRGTADAAIDVLVGVRDTVCAAGAVLADAPPRTVVVGALDVTPDGVGTVVDLVTDPAADVPVPNDAPGAIGTALA